ncbi:DUF3800 domain-containing protein [Nonomuraea sediminis]|uniref:DUF3800 domain-containing protein n=1 Tax=Nonomuraea sediminis TaxID=2835864 RepID=UPI001BDC54F3|nr:DUF3800 domain-containing protein [Nonomuraea sediminis]
MRAEIACDESGAEGENLIDGVTDVFAHAGVLLTVEVAEECVLELRRRIRSPAEEYKANHLLRGKHRGTLLWLLGPDGPIHGQAGVLLVEKAFFAAARAADLLRGRLTYAVDTGPGALALYREHDFLRAFNELMRARITAEAFAEQVAALRLEIEITHLVRQAETYHDHRDMLPVLDPLVPALLRAVARWRPAAIVHDQQTTLTEDRIAQLDELVGGPTGLRLVDSRDDARVQVADFLAGVARKIASEELNGRGDRELTELLRPYVDPASVWGDQRSWAELS